MQEEAAATTTAAWTNRYCNQTRIVLLQRCGCKGRRGCAERSAERRGGGGAGAGRHTSSVAATTTCACACMLSTVDARARAADYSTACVSLLLYSILARTMMIDQAYSSTVLVYSRVAPAAAASSFALASFASVAKSDAQLGFFDLPCFGMASRRACMAATASACVLPLAIAASSAS